MIFSCNQLYHSLQRNLWFRSIGTPSGLDEVEQYFKCCFPYWMEVYKLMAAHPFCSVQEEVCFFRRVKPLFTSELEYAQLLCNALLFLPEDGDRRAYWEREGKRLASFINEHASFWHYYRSGTYRDDAAFFTRADPALCSVPARIYPDEGLVSLYDPLVGRLLALQRYNAYVQGKLGSAL
jgi:hypothetical protein